MGTNSLKTQRAGAIYIVAIIFRKPGRDVGGWRQEFVLYDFYDFWEIIARRVVVKLKYAIGAKERADIVI
jgi:hypothetical protein